jgi:DNA-binding NarL/FixJ family response regulator
MSTRILVADDHEIFAEGLCALLEKEANLEVTGRASGGDQAVKLSREKLPDIVIMDMSMPDISGIEATRLIKAERPAVKVLCLSMHTDRGFVMGALNAGASGYVLKDSAKVELLHAIRTVMGDAVYLSPNVTGIVVDAATSGSASAALALLTERESEVLQRLVQGATTKEIADQLYLSVKTIGTHRAHIMDKLDIHSIAALTKFAIREGLTSGED